MVRPSPLRRVNFYPPSPHPIPKTLGNEGSYTANASGPEFACPFPAPVRGAFAERMKDRLNQRLIEEGKLKDEVRLTSLTLQHEDEKANNREIITKALANLGRVIEALPPAQRRELLQALISRIVVKPWDGQKAGIEGGVMTIVPQVGTRRYMVNLTLSESSLLSETKIAKVDESTLAIKWLPGLGSNQRPSD